MKKTLITFLIFTAFFNTVASAQSTKTYNKKYLFISGYFDNDVLDAYSPGDVVAYVRMTTKKTTRSATENGNKGKRTSTEGVYEIRLKNETCIDAKYKVSYTLKERTEGFEIVGLAGDTFTDRGIIKANSNILIKKTYGRQYKELTDYKLIEVEAVNKYGTVINEENWRTDTTILKCLGYNSISEFQRHIDKKVNERLQSNLEEERRVTKEKEIALAKKKSEENKWNAKGLDVHIANYKTKQINGMYVGVPCDSLVMISKHLNLPLLIINTGPRKYKKGDFKLDSKSINFFKDNYVVGVFRHHDRSFWDWVRTNNYNIKYSPIIVMLGTDNKIQATGNDFIRDFNDNTIKLLSDIFNAENN